MVMRIMDGSTLMEVKIPVGYDSISYNNCILRDPLLSLPATELTEDGSSVQDIVMLSSPLQDEPSTNQHLATYATLMPLAPLSPVSDSEKLTLLQGSFDASLDSSIDTTYLKFDRDVIDTTLSGYEFLEPLMPTAMLDGSGNALQSSNAAESQTVSLRYSCYANTLLPPIAHEFGQTSEDPPRMSNISRIFPRDCSTPSSRASSPDISRNDSFFSIGDDRSRFRESGFGADEEEINTKEVAEMVNNEMKRFNIPQVLFAQKILCRSQGTLSDLLRNPKPWAKLKSGRETFTRMWKWLQEPEEERMAFLRLPGYPVQSRDYLNNSDKRVLNFENPIADKLQTTVYAAGEAKIETCLAEPTGSSVSRLSASVSVTKSKSGKSKSASDRSSKSRYSSTDDYRKRRMVFTETQRRALRNIFRETPRPNKELQTTIAQQLGLPVGTVSNFFMNARRRSRDKWLEEEEGEDDLEDQVGQDDTTSSE